MQEGEVQAEETGSCWKPSIVYRDEIGGIRRPVHSGLFLTNRCLPSRLGGPASPDPIKCNTSTQESGNSEDFWQMLKRFQDRTDQMLKSDRSPPPQTQTEEDAGGDEESKSEDDVPEPGSAPDPEKEALATEIRTCQDFLDTIDSFMEKFLNEDDINSS